MLWVTALKDSLGRHHMAQYWSSNKNWITQECLTYGYCTFLLLCSDHLCSTIHQLYTDWSSERDLKWLNCTDSMETGGNWCTSRCFSTFIDHITSNSQFKLPNHYFCHQMLHCHWQRAALTVQKCHTGWL